MEDEDNITMLRFDLVARVVRGSLDGEPVRVRLSRRAWLAFHTARHERRRYVTLPAGGDGGLQAAWNLVCADARRPLAFIEHDRVDTTITLCFTYSRALDAEAQARVRDVLGRFADPGDVIVLDDYVSATVRREDATALINQILDLVDGATAPHDVASATEGRA